MKRQIYPLMFTKIIRFATLYVSILPMATTVRLEFILLQTLNDNQKFCTS